jgi:hypothetical protein
MEIARKHLTQNARSERYQEYIIIYLLQITTAVHSKSTITTWWAVVFLLKWKDLARPRATEHSRKAQSPVGTTCYGLSTRISFNAMLKQLVKILLLAMHSVGPCLVR